MSSIPSFQDLLADFSEEIFVGRSEQLSLFEKALSATRSPFLILAICGQGGVGKTTLLEQLRHIANSQEVLTALVNEDQATIPATLAHFASQFDEAGYACKNFSERYRKYRELKEQVEADPKAPKGALDFALRSAARISMRSLRRVPIAGEAADVLLTPETENLVADEVSTMAAYVAQKFTNKDERVLLLETNQELTRHFLTDLNRHAQTRRIVFFFDTYEKTAVFLDTWLRDLLLGKFGKFSSQVLFVIAGRYPLGQAWTCFKRATKQIQLYEFTETEAREYLERFGITDEKQILQLLKLSDCLPVLLALLVSAPGDLAVEVSGDAVERFLQETSSEQRKAALTGSVPRFFNQDTLAIAIGSEEAAGSAFDWLSQAHFVRSGTEGWFYHDVVRSLMLRYFRLRSTQHCTEIHSKLVAYYQAKVDVLSESNLADDHRSNETWRKLEIERLYHLLSHNPLSQLNETLIGFLADLEHEDRSILRSYVQLLIQVSDETGELILSTWASRLEQLISFLDDDLPAEKVAETLAAATCLCDLDDLEKEYRGRAYLLRGRIHHRKAQDYPAAIADFTQAIELQPNNGMTYRWRGATYLWKMKSYSAALADYSKAVELEPTNGYNYLGRGQVNLTIKDFPAAMADLDKVIELLPEYFFLKYLWRGRAHLMTGDYSAALADCSKAIELQPEDGMNYQWRGHTYMRMSNYSAALADYSKAVELQPENGYNHLGRGRAHLRMENYAAALVDLDKVVEYLPEYLFLKYQWNGQIHFAAKNYSAGLADFSKAIELEPEDWMNYQWRGYTYERMKDYPAALTDYSKAVELQPENGYNYLGRGRVHLRMENYAAALPDLDKAITSIKSAYTYAWRGRAYLAMKDATKAQTDFAQVEAMLNKEGRPAYIVAAGYSQLHQVSEACTWLHRAFKREQALVSEVRTDSEFDPINASAEFRELIAQYTV